MDPKDTPEDLQARLDDAMAELERIKLTLEVVGTVDLESGIHNRNGLLESVERSRKWQARRGDIFGMMVVRFPDMPVPLHPGENDADLVRHVAATVAAGVREVDDVGRVDEITYGAVLADLQPGAIVAVVDRVERLIGSLVAAESALGGAFVISAVEVLNTGHTAATVIDTALRMATDASPGTPEIGQI